jgi:hypothetical protein
MATTGRRLRAGEHPTLEESAHRSAGEEIGKELLEGADRRRGSGTGARCSTRTFVGRRLTENRADGLEIDLGIAAHGTGQRAPSNARRRSVKLTETEPTGILLFTSTGIRRASSLSHTRMLPLDFEHALRLEHRLHQDAVELPRRNFHALALVHLHHHLVALLVVVGRNGEGGARRSGTVRT